ncbi:hypothetical protein CYMTET_25586 [Cymbomonas tetramitiformis]|uniref:Uncharacterized protein n=1 Tax=Cymbomonas tetramitiformis TaxID=36881 RepID=A0AAE0KZ28_9CHLO|nr:hypothetical protein CYMTET_25586 [Cymbomonas tetramitiformis]
MLTTTVKLAKSIGINGSYDILTEVQRKSYADGQKRAKVLQDAKVALDAVSATADPTGHAAALKKLTAAQKTVALNKSIDDMARQVMEDKKSKCAAETSQARSAATSAKQEAQDLRKQVENKMMTEKAELISKVKQQEQERSRLQQEAAAAAKEQRVLLQQVARSMPTAADMKRKRNLEKRQVKDSTVSTLLLTMIAGKNKNQWDDKKKKIFESLENKLWEQVAIDLTNSDDEEDAEEVMVVDVEGSARAGSSGSV